MKWEKSLVIKIIAIGTIIISLAIISVNLSNPNSLLHSILSTHKENLVDASIVVSPGHYVSYSATAPTGSNNCKITGSFSARGGNDDIIVYVVDQNEFANLQNGENFNVYYSTPQQISGNFNVGIPCDKTIYLVFSNTFSIITSKTVTVKADFEYER